MKPHTQTLKSCSAILISGMAFTLTAQATLVVDWGGDYVSSDQAMLTGGFSSGDPLTTNPTIGVNYDGTSAAFVGQNVASNGDISGFVIDDNSSADRIQFRSTGGAVAVSADGLTLWNAFIGTTDPIAFDVSSTLSINIATAAGSVNRRFVLRDSSGNYYASTITGFNATGTTTFNPTTTSWFDFDPTTSLTSIGSAATIDFNTTDFSEVGFLINLSSSISAQAVRVDSFEVNAVSIPEPSQYALLSAVVLGLAVYLRRAKRIRTSSFQLGDCARNELSDLQLSASSRS